MWVIRLVVLRLVVMATITDIICAIGRNPFYETRDPSRKRWKEKKGSRRLKDTALFSAQSMSSLLSTLLLLKRIIIVGGPFDVEGIKIGVYTISGHFTVSHIGKARVTEESLPLV